MNTTLKLRVGNLDFENEAAQIRRGLEHLPGIKEPRVFPKSAKVMISVDETILKPDAVKSALTQMGYPVLPSKPVAGAPKPWKHPKVIASVLSGVVLGLTYLFENVTGLVWLYASLLYALGMLIGGYYFGREALGELLKKREVGINARVSLFHFGSA